MTTKTQNQHKYNWTFRENPSIESSDIVQSLVKGLGISEFLARVLAARGYNSIDDARAFINPSEGNILPPQAIPGVDQAVDRLVKAVNDRESVMVHGDYDVDGIAGAVILHDNLKKLGCQAKIFLPRRDFHGFGLSEEAVQKAVDGKIELIVTVDCGISSADAVKTARDAGIDVIITDHHVIPEDLPENCTVVHPELNGDYPGGKLAGATVGYKLVLALLEKLGGDFEAEKFRLMPLVALATVADVVPLTLENRTLVSLGLNLFNETQIPGLQVLRAGSLRDGKTSLSARDIAFGIAPMINAAGRMGDPYPAAKLLLAPDSDKAWDYYRKLDRINNERKRIMRTVTDRLLKLPEVAWGEDENKILALVDQDCSPGLAGLAAMRISEKTGRPTVILAPSKDPDGLIYRGSMRTSGDTDLLSLMEPARVPAENLGGHKGALGLTVKPENLDSFLEVAREITFERQLEELELDFEVNNAPKSSDDVIDLDSTRPWGTGNPAPSFAFGPVIIEKTRIVGKTQEHLQVVFAERSGKQTKGIGFFLAERFGKGDSIGKEGHAAGTFTLNNWQGNTSIEFQIEDIHIK